MSTNDKLSSEASSLCDVESLQLAVEGEGTFNSIVKRHRGMEEGDVTERDKDDENGIRLTVESRFENKKTVLNW